MQSKPMVCNFTSVKTWSGTFYHNGALTIMDLEWCCNYCNIYYPWTQNLKTKRKPIRLPVVFHIYIHDTYCMPLVIFHFDQNINSWTLVLGEPLPAVYLVLPLVLLILSVTVINMLCTNAARDRFIIHNHIPAFGCQLKS